MTTSIIIDGQTAEFDFSNPDVWYDMRLRAMHEGAKGNLVSRFVYRHDHPQELIAIAGGAVVLRNVRGSSRLGNYMVGPMDGDGNFSQIVPVRTCETLAEALAALSEAEAAAKRLYEVLAARD